MPKLKPPFKLNVPMLLTWMRIAMIPLVIGIFYLCLLYTSPSPRD